MTTYDPVPLLRAKLHTVLIDKATGRGNYDRLSEIADSLRAAIAKALKMSSQP
jgi:hypothetical protein